MKLVSGPRGTARRGGALLEQSIQLVREETTAALFATGDAGHISRLAASIDIPLPLRDRIIHVQIVEAR